MKVAIITDTHYGCRKGSRLFHDYFEKFYSEVFFPTLDEEGIDTVIHMGDAFDSRKGIDFRALTWAKRVVFEPLKQRGIQMHLMVGNHDAYYKNTNEINSVELLLQEYDNVRVYSKTTEVELGGLNMVFIPWINEENEKETTDIIQKTKAPVAFGHLELKGFKVNRQITMDHGLEADIFFKFEKVFSGHYHTRSDNGTVYYLGNPYEMFWSDVKDPRGFHIFDTETKEHTPVNNPFRLFYNIYYEDTNYQTFNTTEYKDKIVKVIVRKRTDVKKFEKFIDKLYSAGVAELKIVENHDFTAFNEKTDSAVETEDTLTILDNYITESETDLDKSAIRDIIRKVYQEACEMV